MAEETYEFHVLETTDFLPIRRAVFSTYEDAEDFISLFSKDYQGELYIVQRLARFDYR